MRSALSRLGLSTPGRTYWDDHQRTVDGKRLCWFGEDDDKDFWGSFWSERVNKEYWAAARKLELSRDELGRELLAELSPTGTHLEAGCGGGYWVAALSAHGLRVEGLELSAPLVEHIHSLEPELSVRCGDALAIDRPDASYDSYLSLGVVEHRRAGPEPFLDEALRVLRPGGKLILTVPYFGAVRQAKARLGYYRGVTPERVPFFQYAFSRRELSDLCAQAGFRVVRTRALYALRMIDEELPLVRWLSAQRGGGYLRRTADKVLAGIDGHMVLVVAVKP